MVPLSALLSRRQASQSPKLWCPSLSGLESRKPLVYRVRLLRIVNIPPKNVEPNQIERTAPKAPGAGILSFRRSNAAKAAPLLFCTGGAHSCRNECICRSGPLLPGTSWVYAGKYTPFLEWRKSFQPSRCHKDFLSLTWTVLCRMIEYACEVY